MKLTSLLSIAFLLSSTDAMRLTTSTSSNSKLAKFNRDKAKERLGEAKSGAKDKATEVTDTAKEAKSAYDDGNYMQLGKIAMDAKDEFAKDKQGALDWGTEAIDEQAGIERNEDGSAKTAEDYEPAEEAAPADNEEAAPAE